MANQTFPWTYRAYGLRLRSDIQVPALLPESQIREQGLEFWGKEDEVTIQTDSSLSFEQLIPCNVAQKSIAVRVIEDRTILYLKDIAIFQIEQGQRIRVHPFHPVESHRLGVALSGVAIAALLFQRGCFIAHGSAVSMAGEGVIFLGDSGAGKSSLAIALHQRGYPIVTDDLAVILERDGIPYLLPAFPQMRVTSETAKALGLPWNQLIPFPNIPKRGFRFEAEFIPQAIPLRHIYVLKPTTRDETHCQSLAIPQQIMELMHHSEVMGLFEDDKTRHFRACASLAGGVPIDYFQRPMDWAKVSTTLHSLETHFSSNSKLS